MSIDTGSTGLTVTSSTQHWVRLAGRDDDRSIDGFELFSAHRALNVLKTKLGRERLLDLLGDEITAGDAFLKGHVEDSGGEEATGTTTLRAHGITAEQFTGWLSLAFAQEDVMLAGHPEHYSIHAAPGRGVNIIETLGECVLVLHASLGRRPGPDPGTGDRRRETGRSAVAHAPERR